MYRPLLQNAFVSSQILKFCIANAYQVKFFSWKTVISLIDTANLTFVYETNLCLIECLPYILGKELRSCQDDQLS